MQRLYALHNDERGQINLLIAIFILGLGIASCFIGGIGERVKDKIEVQNGADAIAYSNGLWMARSMNAITTTNHLMGELTAIVVIQESFGGPELDEGKSILVEQSKYLTQISKTLKESAPYPENGLLPIFHTPDTKIVKAAFDMVADDDGESKTGGALFDSQMLLKHELAATFALKSFCTVLNEVAVALVDVGITSPIGVAVEVVADAGHVYADKLLFDLIQERVFIEGLEAALPAFGAFKEPTRQVVIPALSQYADGVAGKAIGGVGIASTSKAPLNSAQKETLRRFKLSYSLQDVCQYPTTETACLPIQSEAVIEKSQNKQVVISPWKGEKLRGSMVGLMSILNELHHAADVVSHWLRWADDIIETSRDVFSVIPGHWLDDAKKIAKIKVPSISEYAAKAIRDMPDINHLKSFDYNPSIKNLEKEENQIDLESEQSSQWMRATYPYVDSFRAPLRNFMHEALPNSGMASYFTHWTNRYTMVEVYKRRRQSAIGIKGNPKKQNKDKDQQVLRLFTEKLLGIRDEFDKATAPPLLGSLQDSLVKLKPITNKLEMLALWIENNNNSDLLDIFGGAIGDWCTGAKSAVNNAKQTASRAIYDPSSDLSENEFRNAIESIALHEAIDQLVNELISQIKSLDAYVNPFGPPHMYVLKDMDPLFKGTETWADNNPPLAESYFTLIICSHRKSKPSAFGPGIFSNPHSNGTTCFSQAIFYNANSRELNTTNDQVQPNTGWDTLNWEPPVQAPEWRAGSPSSSRIGKEGGKWPWEWSLPTKVFTGMDSGKTARVKLNWQCKLTPITQRRLKALVNSSECPDSVVNAGKFILTHSKMLSH